MTTAATPLLGLALPVSGELSGTWGDTVNNSLTSLVDDAVAGTTTLSIDVDVTLSTTTLAPNQARNAVILWTAGGTATRTITAPALSKSYIVINKTSSTQSIKLVGAGPTTGVTIIAGTAALVAWNGLDFVTISVISTSGVLPVASGGTGATTLTANGVLIGNGISAVTAVSPSTSGNVLTSNGTAWASVAIPTQFPTGGIIMWSGSIASIPAGWLLCNGTSGTPDLRNRFVIGASVDNAGVANTTVTGANTLSGGTANAVVVAHTHTATTTSTDSGHTHTYNTKATTFYVTGSTVPCWSFDSTATSGTSYANITSATTVDSAGVSGTNANLPPYYALAYIMKS